MSISWWDSVNQWPPPVSGSPSYRLAHTNPRHTPGPGSGSAVEPPYRVRYGSVDAGPAPTFPGTLRGYRAFSLAATINPGPFDDPRWVSFDPAPIALRSATARYTYQPGVNVAACDQVIARQLNVYNIHSEEGAPAPQVDCSCGFYAAHAAIPDEYWGFGVHGVVKASGRVLIGEAGFRAEKVEIEALCTSTTHPSPFGVHLGFTSGALDGVAALGVGVFDAQVGKKFGVPVFSEKAAMMEAFPPQDLEGLLP